MNIRKYLPYENFILTSGLSIEEIMNRLGDVVGPERSQLFYWFNDVSEFYEGDLRNTTFKIRRIIHDGRNNFAPVITGSMTTLGDKTAIHIKMRLSVPITILMTVWLGFVGLICLYFIIAGFSGIRYLLRHGFNPVCLLPFGMFVFGSVVPAYQFKSESKRARDFLVAVMEGGEKSQ